MHSQHRHQDSEADHVQQEEEKGNSNDRADSVVRAKDRIRPASCEHSADPAPMKHDVQNNTAGQYAQASELKNQPLINRSSEYGPSGSGRWSGKHNLNNSRDGAKQDERGGQNGVKDKVQL